MIYDHLSLTQSSLEALHSTAKASDYFADSFDLVKLHLQLVDLLQNGAEAGDFGVGVL